ncbi:MAG: hypothetical protein ACXIUQ_12030 [Cecembia sp.]
MIPVLIYSGSNDRAIIAFCRYAEKAKINYLIIANGEDDIIFQTSYRKKVFIVRSRNVLTIDTLLEHIKIAKAKFFSGDLFILPSTEFLNRFLLEHQEILLTKNVSFGLCERELYASISDKYQFAELCKKYSINIPFEYSIKPKKYPYVIKSKKYFSENKMVSEKPAIIKSPEDEIKFISKFNNEEAFFQEYIEGESFYLLFYFFKDGRYSVYSQRNLIQQHDGGSMILCRSDDCHTDLDLVNPYLELFVKEGFFGLVMVEIKKFKGQYYMIEANPRLWGPSQLILDSEMDLFDCFAKENNLSRISTTSAYKIGTWYFWSGGLAKTQRLNKNVKFHDCSYDYFFKNYFSIIEKEVYNRNDSMFIFNKENSL